MIRAALMVEKGEPLEVGEVHQEPPKANELEVRIVASGVCHSDLNLLMRGGRKMPMVLGHEGAGIVELVGPGVTGFERGDHVVLSLKPSCGVCWYCVNRLSYLCQLSSTAKDGLLDGTPRMSRHGQPVWQMACIGTFAERSIVPAQSAVKIPSGIPLKLAALLGCGVLTGFGAAVNAADIRPGDTVAILGCGGVGLNTIQGARLCGAREVIGIDILESKLEMAERFGATSRINSADFDPVEAVRDLTLGRGADHVFEVIGNPQTIEQAIEMTRPGGEMILIGSGDAPFEIVSRPFVHASRTLKGSLYGSSNFREDVPKLIDLYERNMLILDDLVSREISLEDINDSFEAMLRGDVARSVVVFDGA